jgi:hypothetical protein
VLVDAAIKGDSIANVIQGKATPHALDGTASSDVTSGAVSTTAASGTYTNPFPGASASRVDQGVDYTITQPVVAPGDFKITAIDTRSGFGNYIAGQLTSGPLAGRAIYFAEGLAAAPGVAVGQTVKAGKPIAVPIAGPYGMGVIEAGWADITRSFDPLAKGTGGYREGSSTAAGVSFNRFIQSLKGGPVGHVYASVLGSIAGLGLP